MGSSIISVMSSTEGAGSPANIGVVQTSFAGEPWEPQRPRLACSIRALGGPVFSGDKGEFGAAFTGGGGGAGGLHTAPMRGISQEALLGQGFGVISEIDVRSTFETKLGEENGQALGGYLILGVCNPALAQRALGEGSFPFVRPRGVCTLSTPECVSCRCCLVARTLPASHETGRKTPPETRGSSCLKSRNFRLGVCWVQRAHPRRQCW